MNAPNCSNPYCKGRQMKVIEVNEAFSFVCPRCHAIKAVSKDAIKKEKKFDEVHRRRTRHEEEFRRREMKKTFVHFGD